MAEMKTLTVYPSGYVTDDYAYASASDIENGYNSADNTTYATINLTTGNSAETYIYYTFDLKNIPSEAVVTNVSCSAKCSISSSAFYISSSTTQLYSGTTAMGTSSTMSTSAATTAITAGDWTTDELRDIRLKLYAKRSTIQTSSSRYISFYGATLTVTYAVPDIVPIIGNTTIGGVSQAISSGYGNISGIWKAICKSYVNVNGVWKPTYKAGEVSFTWKKYAVDAEEDTTTYSLNTQTSQIYYPSASDDVNEWKSFFTDTLSKTEKFTSSRNFDQTTGTVTYGLGISIQSTWSSLKTFRDWIGNYINYFEYDNYHYRVVGGTNSNDEEKVSVEKEKVVSKVTEGEKTQGAYIEDVTSSNYNAYPDNGIQDGYWYVRQ